MGVSVYSYYVSITSKLQKLVTSLHHPLLIFKKKLYNFFFLYVSLIASCRHLVALFQILGAPCTNITSCFVHQFI